MVRGLFLSSHVKKSSNIFASSNCSGRESALLWRVPEAPIPWRFSTYWLELREELGVVLSVAHFHHQIRGAEADADQQFVQELAADATSWNFILVRATLRSTRARTKSALKRLPAIYATNGLPS